MPENRIPEPFSPRLPARRAAASHNRWDVALGGSGRILLDGEVRDLRQWDTVRVAPEVLRAFEAGPDGLEFLAIGGPRPEEGDGEMGEVQWPAD